MHDYFEQIKNAVCTLGRLGFDKNASYLHTDYDYSMLKQNPQMDNEKAVLEVMNGLTPSQQTLLQYTMGFSSSDLLQGKADLVPVRSTLERLSKIKECIEGGWEKCGTHYVLLPTGSASADGMSFLLAKNIVSGFVDTSRLAVKFGENGHSRVLIDQEIDAVPGAGAVPINQVGLALTEAEFDLLKQKTGMNIQTKQTGQQR